MFDSSRSRAYHCSSDSHNQTIASHCFELVKRAQPQFNICGLESSYTLDKSVPNIEDRVTKAIPQELLYACRFWADHIEAGKCAPALVEQLQDFLSMRLLLWMEVLNLNQQMESGTECMRMMIKWCDQLEAHPELVKLARNAQQFVEAFASNPVSQSTPHIYVSMLTFWPKSAPIAKHYAKYARGPVHAEGMALEQRQLAHLATWAFAKGIGSMTMSHDGLYIALAVDRDVLVVDSSSGRVTLGPLKGHPNVVQWITFSLDGTRVVAGSTNYDTYYATILGWDTRTGKTVLGPLQLDGHTNSIQCLSFSPDCTCIATGSEDKSVYLWNTENGEMLHHLGIQDPVSATAFSPNGIQIAAVFAKSLQIWDRNTGDTTLGPITTPVQAYFISFSPDNSCIIYGSNESIYIHALDGQSEDTILRPVEGYTYGINCIGCSSNGRYIVSGSGERTVCLWDAQNGNLLLGPLEAHMGWVNSVAFSPDGACIISACGAGLVCTWDARQRNLTFSPNNASLDGITCVKFSSDGTRFVSGSEVGTICIWDTHTGGMVIGPIKAHTSRINAVDFLNNYVVSGSEDGNICVCNAPKGAVVVGPLEILPNRKVQAIAYSPDGKQIATGSDDEVDLWDAHTGTRVLSPLTGLQGSVMSIQFSPDGSWIVGGSQEYGNNIATWNVSDGKSLCQILDGHSHWVLSVSYSPNGALIASGSYDWTIIIWDAYTGKRALSPLIGHSDYVRSVHFSPCGTRLVSGSTNGTIRIWDVQTGEMVFELLNGHESFIISVAYSPDGARILSHSYDMSVRIHDARSPEERALSQSECEVGDWTIDKDGWVVDDRGRLLVWVPGILRKALMWSNTQVMVAPQGYVRLRFDKSRMGESWANVFSSDS
ncbi:unnamed protein product [Rhizoctonia solani]|uniref:Vegetative incompatibility protein HET-E-1 n=1 Tax=Rhizoctonia solani TaxID=456999 RepID=A0A8H3AIV9_9AGAM|nr:unnamed protein product [Rhizoctonia solani]